MITYTNYAKNIYDQIKTLITTEIADYLRPGRFIFRDRPSVDDFGRYSFFRCQVNSDNVNTHENAGRTRVYDIALIYYERIDPEIKYDKITDVAEHIEELIDNNRSNSAYWHFADVVTIEYGEPPLPEGLTGYYGFVMTLNIYKGKY